MKNAFSILVLVGLILGLLIGACGQPEVVEVEKVVEVEVPAEKPVLYFSIFNAKHPVVRLMRLGFWDACADFESVVDCEEVLVMEPDVDGYVSAMEQVGTLGGSAAVIYNDSDALIAGAEGLQAVMPTVSFHKPFDIGESPNSAWVSADTCTYAINAAKRIGEKLGGEGVVATSMSSAESQTESVVQDCFKEEMAKSFPGIEVLAPEYETVEVNEATGIAEAKLIGNPEIAAVFTSTGAGANAWATALRGLGREPGEVVVVGMDATAENLALIESGEVWAVVAQPLVEEVYAATEIALKIALGMPYEEQNWLDAPFVTADKAAKFKDYAIRAMED